MDRRFLEITEFCPTLHKPGSDLVKGLFLTHQLSRMNCLMMFVLLHLSEENPIIFVKAFPLKFLSVEMSITMSMDHELEYGSQLLRFESALNKSLG